MPLYGCAVYAVCCLLTVYANRMKEIAIALPTEQLAPVYRTIVSHVSTSVLPSLLSGSSPRDSDVNTYAHVCTTLSALVQATKPKHESAFVLYGLCVDVAVSVVQPVLRSVLDSTGSRTK